MGVTWNGSSISLNDETLTAEAPVLWAELVRGVIAVLLDPDASSGSVGVFENLLAIDTSGREIWRAPLPTSQTGDCFVEAREELGQVVATTWSGHQVRIDAVSGEIVAQEINR